MDEQQFMTLLQTLGDLHTGVDALSLELEDIREHIAPETAAHPGWVGAKERAWEGISEQIASEALRGEQLAGVRGAGLVALAVLGAVILIVFAVLYLVGGGWFIG
jgi:hypothetical protein